jgi:CRP-like cAMP-binding protein
VPLFATSPTPVTAIALETTRCLIITRHALESAIAIDQQVVWILLRRMADRVRLLVDRLDHMALQTAGARFAPLLAQAAVDRQAS